MKNSIKLLAVIPFCLLFSGCQFENYYWYFVGFGGVIQIVVSILGLVALASSNKCDHFED